jgi:hypothetical protein
MRHDHRNRSKSLSRNKRKTRPGTRSLVVINDKPIRKKAVARCRSLLKKYRGLKRELEVFEKTDKPMFTAWLNTTFSTIMGTIRALREENTQTANLIKIIEMVRTVRKVRPQEAYEEAMQIKDDPLKVEELFSAQYGDIGGEKPFDEDACSPDDDDDWEDYDFGDEEKGGEGMPGGDGGREFRGDGDFEYLDDRDLESFFFDFLHDIPGYEEILTNDKLFNQMFRQFKSQFFKTPGDESSGADQAPLFETVEPKADDAGIKSLYRTMALLLHPDNQAAPDEEKKELWFKVQDAYRSRNLEELKALHALSGIQDGRVTDQCSVSQMMRIQDDHGEQIAVLRQIIGKKRKDPAWNFSGTGDKAALYRTTLAELNRTLEEETRNKRYYTGLLKKWSEPAGRRDPSKPNKSRFVPPPEQMELQF